MQQPLIVTMANVEQLRAACARAQVNGDVEVKFEGREIDIEYALEALQKADAAFKNAIFLPIAVPRKSVGELIEALSYATGYNNRRKKGEPLYQQDHAIAEALIISMEKICLDLLTSSPEAIKMLALASYDDSHKCDQCRKSGNCIIEYDVRKIREGSANGSVKTKQ